MFSTRDYGPKIDKDTTVRVTNSGKPRIEIKDVYHFGGDWGVYPDGDDLHIVYKYSDPDYTWDRTTEYPIGQGDFTAFHDLAFLMIGFKEKGLTGL